jgi:hypothetical protein
MYREEAADLDVHREIEGTTIRRYGHPVVVPFGSKT